MEKSTWIGVILGVAALVFGMLFKGANPMAILTNVAAITIILGGTAACVFVAFPLSDLKKLPKLFGILLRSKS